MKKSYIEEINNIVCEHLIYTGKLFRASEEIMASCAAAINEKIKGKSFMVSIEEEDDDILFKNGDIVIADFCIVSPTGPEDAEVLVRVFDAEHGEDGYKNHGLINIENLEEV
jgi:hypothetical protein